MSFNQPSILLITSSVISMFLSVYAWKRRPDMLGKFLSMILAAATVWSFFYSFEVASTNQIQMMVFGSFEYIGIACIPVIWLIFASMYCGKDGWVNPLTISLLFIVPVISCIMFATNNLHHLFYSSVELKMMDGYRFQKYEAGPFWYIHVIYSYTALALGLSFFVQMFFKVAHTHRLHIGLFLTGSLLPFVVNILYIAGLKPFGFLDLTPIAFIVMGAIFIFGVFTINLFDINPIVLDVLFNNIPDATFVLDSNKRIINANPAALAMINSSQTNWDDRLKSNSSLFETYLTSKNDASEIVFNNKTYQKTKTVINSSKGKYLGTLIILHDITEQKSTEAQLIENEIHLRELNATKDKFFSIIAHDLLNPFNSIVGLSDYLAEQVHVKNYDEIEQYAYIIQKSSYRAMDLLLNLLEWSRSQTGRMEFNPENVEFTVLINQVTELLIDSDNQKSITIVKELPDSVTVVADKNMMGAILRNLISNAIKFTSPGGHIVISVLQNQDGLMVAVADTGVGIEEDNLEKLFRIDGNYSTLGTQKEQGTGLGLILCKEFIEKHGGKIWAESEVGEGSKFIFTIPK